MNEHTHHHIKCSPLFTRAPDHAPLPRPHTHTHTIRVHTHDTRYTDVYADECASDKGEAATTTAVRKAACFEVLNVLFDTLQASDVRGDIADGSGTVEIEYLKARRLDVGKKGVNSSLARVRGFFLSFLGLSN